MDPSAFKKDISLDSGLCTRAFGHAIFDSRQPKRRNSEELCRISAFPTRGTDFARPVRVPERSSTFLGRRGAAARRVKYLSESRIVRSSLENEPLVLETWSMNDTYDALGQRLWKASKMKIGSDRYIVGLAGPPGAGKTTVAREVVARVNRLWREEMSSESDTGGIAVAVPMDGFHIYRRQLDAMEDPTEAHARRGAHWTFDAAGLLKAVSKLRKEGSVSLPSFDHGVGDPVEDDIRVEHWHRVVLVEGNYLLLTDGAWKDVGAIFDEKWFVAVDLDEAMDRVEKRHVITGKPPEVAKWRVAYNDRPNAELIQASRSNADLVIRSVPL